MKRESGSLSALLIVLVGLGLIVILNEVKVVDGAELSPGQCKEERRLGINACKPVVFGQAASAACCVRVRVSHFECVCPAFDPKLAALIPISRATKILQDCGRRVPRHFKCGSLNFP